VLPSADIGRTVDALAVVDRQIDHLQIEFGRSEQEIKVAERIEVAKKGPAVL
jgi:hypothetical protein